MEKSLFERMGGTYHQEGDYFLPDLSVPELPAIGIWGQRRRRYLKEHRQALYTALLLSGKLNDHLSEVDEQAEAMFSQLVKQMAAQDSITEQFKADNQMEWVRQMNSARNRAEEVIYNKLIYACREHLADCPIFKDTGQSVTVRPDIFLLPPLFSPWPE